MTKWQESCITALASSPYTWEAFKLKQKNKNLLWQYINRIWPYRRVENDCKMIAENNKTLENALKLLLFTLQNNKERIIDSRGLEFSNIEFIIRPSDTIVVGTAQYNSKRKSPRAFFNHFLGGKRIDVYAGRDLIDNLLSAPVNVTLYFDRICSSLNYPEEQYNCCVNNIEILLETYKKFKKDKTKKRKKVQKTIINWLNVGIEIEHDAENSTNPKIIRKILQQNCKSYDSGYDGNSTDRLRENRIRLNGIKGLKGLYTLLQDMQENAAIANKSSVHIHIDCKYDDSFDEIIKKIKKKHGSIIKTFIKTISPVFEEFKIIFKIDETITKNQLIENSDTPLRFSGEFYTIEYRFCIPNFNYSDYVIQILFLIHITECVKHNAKINKNYIGLLTKIVTKLRN